MYIHCPKCGRRGRLPDAWAPEAYSLRCRKCQAMFTTPELASQAGDRGLAAGFDAIAGMGRKESRSAYLTDGYFSGFEEPMVATRPAGPGDSNYELTFTLGDAEGQSDPGWDAGIDLPAPELPSSDEIPVLRPADDALGPDSWPHRFLADWGARLIVAALVLVGTFLAVLIFLLARILGQGAPPDWTAAALVAGFAGAVALLMLSVPLILLAALMSQLVREVRRLGELPGDRTGPGRR